jgi:hypothetical protein
MACLNINISKVLSPIKATISVASIFNIATSDISERMQVKYSVVCDVPNGGYFLIVEPEIVWLTESNDWSHDFEVQSNVDWIVD